MKYGQIDKMVEEFLKDNNYSEKDVLVEVFPQGVAINGKIKNVEVVVIREKNLETVDIYFDDMYRYTLYDPNENFMKDLKNHEIKDSEITYQD